MDNYKEKKTIVKKDGRERKEYDYIGKFVNGFAVVVLNGRYGYINDEFEEIVPPQYILAYEFRNGFARVVKDGLFGFINEKGDVVVPFKYEYAEDFYNGIAEVRREKFSAATYYYTIYLYGYVDEKGNEVVPLEYEKVVHEFGIVTATKHDENGQIQLDQFYEKDLISDNRL